MFQLRVMGYKKITQEYTNKIMHAQLAKQKTVMVVTGY